MWDMKGKDSAGLWYAIQPGRVAKDITINKNKEHTICNGKQVAENQS